MELKVAKTLTSSFEGKYTLEGHKNIPEETLLFIKAPVHSHFTMTKETKKDEDTYTSEV